MDKKLVTNLNPTARVGMSSIYRMSDAPPNWAQDDPTQPDYIKNKQEAEKLRPIYVNGRLVLDDTHESGPVNLVEGNGVSIVVEGNNVIFEAIEGEDSEDFNYLPGNGITIFDAVDGYKTITIDELYLLDEIVNPTLDPLLDILESQEGRLAILIGDDIQKSVREIATEVSQEEVAEWFAENSREGAILEQLDALTTLVDIEQPISEFVNETVDKRVEELGGSSSTPATSSKLGVVKLDGQTIKMNEQDQIYVSEMSTDNLVQGEHTLVLDGGNNL